MITSISKPIAIISFFRSYFRSFRLMSLVFFSLLVVISCGDTSTDSSAGDPPIGNCPTDYIENPANKAELVALIDKYIGGTITNTNSVFLNLIDISSITNMSELFKDNTDFNGDISCWDMSGVTNVNSMFEGATNFNQDLSSWKLKAGVIAKGSNSPTKMFYKSGMQPGNFPGENFFQYTPANNAALKTAIAAEIATTAQGAEADLSIIDTSRVTDMSELFKANTTFNGYIATWDTSSVTIMRRLFEGATNFNQPIGNWKTGKVTDMSKLFELAEAFNQPIGDWDTRKVTDMNRMFHKAYEFNQPIGNWKTESVNNMAGMFWLAKAFNQDISGWKDTGGPNIQNMFLDVIKMDEANKAGWMPLNTQ